MASVERALDRGMRRGRAAVSTLGQEYRHERVALGVSQRAVAAAARIVRSRYSDIENGKVERLSVIEASRIASVLGLDLVVRTYPGGTALRDAGQARRLQRFLTHVRAPLRYRTDVPLPQRPDQPTEQRAWDAVLFGYGRRTGVELEAGISDAQAMTRRHGLKRRDDPMEAFLLVLADTRTNRRVHRENADLWPDLPRLRTSVVFRLLESGQHPPTGIIFL